jgi:hypothetical protein
MPWLCGGERELQTRRISLSAVNKSRQDEDCKAVHLRRRRARDSSGPENGNWWSRICSEYRGRERVAGGATGRISGDRQTKDAVRVAGRRLRGRRDE